MASTKEKPAAKPKKKASSESEDELETKPKKKATSAKTVGAEKKPKKQTKTATSEVETQAIVLSSAVPSFGSIADDDLTLEDELRAQVMEIRSLPVGQRRTVLLDLADQYPDSIWPFADLSGIMGRAKENLEMAERGLANAMKYEDPAFIEQHRGHFWELRETQGYMRLLLHKARGLMDVRRLDAALGLLEKTLEL